MKHLQTDNFKNGFTLIELLVVITIIAILSVVGLNTFQGVFKVSRDNKRLSDLKLIQSALEDYHADQIAYPASLTFGGSLKSGSKTYLNSVPKDPLGTTEYSYVQSGCPGASCTYCLYANMEGTAPLSDSGCTPASPYDYGVTRP